MPVAWEALIECRVLLADEEVMLRQALKPLLERHGLTVIAEASNSHEAVERAQTQRPDVAVVDTVMPSMNGLQPVRDMLRVCPRLGVILLSLRHDDRHVLEAFQAGVRGFVAKTQAVEDLVQAIRDVSRGGIWVASAIASAFFRAGQTGRILCKEKLTVREHEVLQLVSEGKSTKQVAAVLKISVKTAAFHRMRLMSRLNIHDTASLVRYAIRHGVISP